VTPLAQGILAASSGARLVVGGAAAAQCLALQRPGKRLFPVPAPARRQKRWLIELGAPA
jgi:hypothetical protein